MEDIKKIQLFEHTPVPKAVMTLAVPTILSSLVMVIYNLADTYFVGMLNNSIQNSAVTLAASGCDVIQSEPGALLCYHNPSGAAAGDHREMERSAEALRNARDCILEMYEARGSARSREELIALMDRDIWITPTQALEYGLIDEVAGLAEPEGDPAAFVAAAGGRIRLTEAMRRKYRDHIAAERETSEQKEQARRALAKIRALASY